MVDFNISNDVNKVVLGAPVDVLLQQVDLLFDTDKYAVLGDPEFGSNYDRYLYTLGFSNASLEAKILSDLYKLDLMGFQPSVEVQIIDGTERDIALIDITFTGNYEQHNKTYVIK